MDKKNGKLSRLGRAGFLRSGVKRQYNRQLFRQVAPVYDAVTRVLSFGRDRAWKTELIGWLTPFDAAESPEAPLCIDLACGTGDLGKLLQVHHPDARVVGIDQSAEMMKNAPGSTVAHAEVFAIQGDMGSIPLLDGSADIVTGGYALRNAPDLAVAVSELARVVRPGGHVALLDFSKSDRPFVQSAQLRALSFWGNLWGWIYHRNPRVYGYIADSLTAFPSAGEFTELLRASGFQLVREKTRMMGMIRLQLLRRVSVVE